MFTNEITATHRRDIMPTYDYKCNSCGRTFEYFQSMSEEPLTECQVCKGSLKRLIGGGLGVIFKGSGFYVTDNKNKNSRTATEKTSTSKDTGKKTSGTTEKTSTKKETAKASS